VSTRRLHLTAMILAMVTLMVTSLTWSAPVKVVHIMANHGEPYLEFLKDRKAAFEAKYPEAEIEILAQQVDYTTKVQLMIAGGSQVDVLDSTHSFMAFSFHDALADLMPYVRASNINLDRDMLDFARPVLMKNGQLFGIPGQVYGVVPSYNRTYFEEMGVTPLRGLPEEEWTWEWLLRNGPRLTKDVDGDGIPETYGIGFPTSFISLSPAINQAGGSMFDSYIHPGRALMTSAPVRTGLGFYVSLKERGIGIPQSTGAYYARRHTAIAMHSAAPDPDTYRGPGVTDVFEAVVHPKGPVRRGGQTFFGPFHVPVDSKQQEWAFRWIAFLGLTEESQVRMLEYTGRMPAHPPTLRRLENYVSGFDAHKRDYLLQVRDACTHADSYPQTLTQAEGSIARFFNPAWNNVVNGLTPLESFLETMQPLMQAELDKLFMNQ
jgi:ABC-type glycerol-3-phosphate transport system substrate-binding protein